MNFFLESSFFQTTRPALFKVANCFKILYIVRLLIKNIHMLKTTHLRVFKALLEFCV